MSIQPGKATKIYRIDATLPVSLERIYFVEAGSPEEAFEKYENEECVFTNGEIREHWFGNDVSEPVEITDPEELKLANELFSQES